MKYKINGGHKLEGKVHISGSKNSVFPCVAAALLTNEEVVLENVSNLRDTEVLIAILKKLGVSVDKNKSTLIIKASNISKFSLPKDLMGRLRGSIVLAGALLGRLGRVNFYHPGGDIIGKRSIETHLTAFRELGVVVKKNNLKYSLSLNQNKNSDIFLAEASVTATENLVLSSVIGTGQVILRNCAKEPHILDLCRMLNQMGAGIKGVGGDTLKITGVGKLNGVKFRISADYLEIGTYIIASAVTGGQIKIEGIEEEDLDPILSPLANFGIKMERNEGSITVYPSKLKSISKLTTNIWPGFPTDLMSVAIVLSTQSRGITLCHDWMYEGRMFFTDKLISMGAKIILADPHRVLVYGPGRLRGRILESPDIRAGMALVVAALCAKGKSIINQAELIERGYEDVTVKLKALGADITREDV